MKRAASLLLALVMALSLTVAASASVTQSQLESAVSGSAAWMLNAAKNPQVGSIGGEWAVVGLARSGYSVPQSYWDSYYKTVETYVKNCKGVLHDKKYTEYSRVIVALTAIGADPTNVAGYDLTKPLGDFDKTVWQGNNGAIWALIALDSGNYSLPAGSSATRQKYVDEILACQLNGGGWNLTDRGGSGTADPDMTGMALQALSHYTDQREVKTAISRAVNFISTTQDSSGGFSSWGSANVESVAQIIVGLCALDLDINDSRFVKNGHSLLDNLLSFRQADGSFRHTGGGDGNSQMSSEQGLYAMAAALRAAKGQSGLYDMDDVTIHVSGNTGGSTGLAGKNPDVKKLAVTNPGKTFSDVPASHPNKTAIEALAARGVLKGRTATQVAPDAKMTRAEFAAMVVRALGLTPKANNSFKDVTSDKWYAGEVGTANTYGIIDGVGGGRFNPEGAVNRQEAATMVARAAKLCGIDTGMSDSAVRNMLAQFGDYTTVAQWARPGLAVCYRDGILDDSVLNIQPKEAIRRCEMAQMLYKLLEKGELL